MHSRREFAARVVIAPVAAAMAYSISTRAAAASSAGQVQTVLGPIPGERMGVTAPHEHVLAGSTDILHLWPEVVGGRAAFTTAAAARLKAMKAAGIDTIVDCTTADLGRDVRLLQDVSRRSGLQIIATTGHWLTPTPAFEARTADELATFFALELERGIEDTGVKPGVIKAASQDGMTPFQERVFRAAARASKRTGAPVTTHSYARNRGGLRQAEILEQEGLDPRRVCIGHSDDSGDFDYLSGLARRGYTLGFDHLAYGLPALGGGANGSPAWQDRAATIKELIDAQLGDRIFLATDWMSAYPEGATGIIDRLNKANPDGSLFNIRNTVPYLRQIGVTDDQIRRVTVENPRAFFAPRG